MVFQKTLGRDFVFSFIAQLCFSSVFCILIPTIPIYLSKFQAKESEIGILVGVFSVSSLILRPFIGKALLTIPERLFMVCGTLIYVASSFAYIIASPFWPLFWLRIFHGVGLALFSTASFTFIANIAPPGAARPEHQLLFFINEYVLGIKSFLRNVADQPFWLPVDVSGLCRVIFGFLMDGDETKPTNHPDEKSIPNERFLSEPGSPSFFLYRVYT
jgi:Major Facilitator Superfamily